MNDLNLNDINQTNKSELQNKNKLIKCIVPHGSGEFVTKAALAAGAGGGTIMMGRGTAESKIAQMLGIGDKSKDVVYIIVAKEKTESVANAIKEAASNKTGGFGVLICAELSYFSKLGDKKIGGNVMENLGTKNLQQMITVIANKGYSDDIMAAARKAGAGGGTVITARGTAKPGDEKFFGVEIVPEKEMLYIIADTSIAQKIIDEINALECLSKPGSGIIFSVPADNFSLLGKTK